MARALMRVGVSAVRAYEVARRIEQDLLSRKQDSIELDRVEELAEEVLGESEGQEAVRDLRRYSDLADLDLPIIVLIGGATGTGKSTVATEVAYRLGVTRVTSTDFVRQTLRAFFSPEFMPSIHYSSFEAGRALRSAEAEEVDPLLHGFLDQTRNVLVGVNAAIERSLAEGWSTVLEGVHLVPGMTAPIADALVVQCVLAIQSEDAHASHFWIRDIASEGARALDKYLDHMGDIRYLQDYIVERRGERGRAGDLEPGPRRSDVGRARARPQRGRTATTGLMAKAVEAVPEQEQSTRPPCICESYARVTERSALGERALARARRRGRLRRRPRARGCSRRSSSFRSTGTIVIGAAEGAERLGAGQRIGAGGEPTDLALDPLEGVGIVARGGGGAMSMIASGPRARSRPCRTCTCGRWPSGRLRAARSTSGARWPRTSRRSRRRSAGGLAT